MATADRAYSLHDNNIHHVKSCLVNAVIILAQYMRHVQDEAPQVVSLTCWCVLICGTTDAS